MVMVMVMSNISLNAVYDGIHYDVLVCENPVQTLFQTDDDAIVAKALMVAEQAFQVYYRCLCHRLPSPSPSPTKNAS